VYPHSHISHISIRLYRTIHTLILEHTASLVSSSSAMHLSFSLVSVLSFALSSNAAPLGSAIEGQRILQLPDGLNNVPMMGKKDAYPRDVPSFTSGFLVPAYPQYMMNRQSKRDVELPVTWHLGKRSPWSLEQSSWVDSLFKPSPANPSSGKRSISSSPGASKTSAGKRSAIPNTWSSPWEQPLRSPQGFRFNEAGHNLLTRDVMYKRNFEPTTIDSANHGQTATSEEQEPSYPDHTSLHAEASLDSPDQGTEGQQPQPEVETHKGIPPAKTERFTPNFWMVPPGNKFNPWVFDVMNSG